MCYSRRKLDITGQRYGRLTVLGPAANVNGRTAWKCRCDCGNETVIRTNRLRSGHTASCGCMKPKEILAVGLPGLTYVEGTCVDWLASKGRWRASICFQGKRRYLGSYSCFEDAVNARKQAEEQLHDKFVDQFSHAGN